MTITKLGDDALFEILIRSFPNPRSACRSKAVCKRWKTLIASPRFNRRFVFHHRSINEAKPPLLFPSDDLQSAGLGFIPMPRDGDGRGAIFDSFNDLLLCGFWEEDEPNAETVRSYLLCNPFMKQWIALPLAPARPIGSASLVARLVCEPRSSSSIINLDLGDDQQGFAYCSEYRFRVVRMYEHMGSMKLDVFCSASGKWTKKALVLDGSLRDNAPELVSCKEPVSCNGIIFLPYVTTQNEAAGVYDPCITAIDPFRLDIPPTPVDVSPLFEKRWWGISISQGAPHLMVFEEGTKPADPIFTLSVWRLDDENCKIWRKVCEGPVKPSLRANYRIPSLCYIAALHPEKPKIVFFRHFVGADADYLSCNLRTGGELEFFKSLKLIDGWRVFLLKLSCWPT